MIDFILFLKKIPSVVTSILNLIKSGSVNRTNSRQSQSNSSAPSIRGSIKGDNSQFIVDQSQNNYYGEQPSKAKSQEPEIEQPLEIIYDPTNPYEQFHSLVTRQNQDGSEKFLCREYRIGIKNLSKKTLRKVSVKMQSLGQGVDRKERFLQFNITDTDIIDINPDHSFFVPLLWLEEPRKKMNLPGMPTHRSAWCYGPIKITASALDQRACIKIFHFNWESKQVLFDSASIDPQILSDEWYEKNTINESWYKTGIIS